MIGCELNERLLKGLKPEAETIVRSRIFTVDIVWREDDSESCLLSISGVDWAEEGEEEREFQPSMSEIEEHLRELLVQENAK